MEESVRGFMVAVLLLSILRAQRPKVSTYAGTVFAGARGPAFVHGAGILGVELIRSRR
jgi:hypothetical protein